MIEPRVTVVVPSYRRPRQLAQCLAGIAALEHLPDEVLVVLRPDDLESVRALAARVDADVVFVTRPGVLAAMAAGASRATGDVIVFFDDDTIPRPNWLTRILAHLQKPEVGGAGGRDVVPRDAFPRVGEAGRLTRWGKMIGNHHLVIGPPREVDVLKGANMAFKRDALALPVHLLGHGAQVYFELATCLWATNRGWHLILDPGAEVLHLPGERFDDDRRWYPSLIATQRAACNFIWCLLTMRPQLAARRLLHGVLIGDRAMPGLARAVVALVRGERLVWIRLVPSVVGQLQAACLILLGRRVRMITFETPATAVTSCDKPSRHGFDATCRSPFGN